MVHGHWPGLPRKLLLIFLGLCSKMTFLYINSDVEKTTTFSFNLSSIWEAGPAPINLMCLDISNLDHVCVPACCALCTMNGPLFLLLPNFKQ